MQNITTTLKKLIDHDQQWKITLLEQWQDIIKHFNATTPIVLLKVTANAVFIGVPHPIWAQELSFSSLYLKNAINEVLKEDRISDVYIKITPNPSQPKKHHSFDKADHNLQNTIKTHYSLTSNEQQCLNNVSDTLLKDNIQQFLMRCKNFRKEK